MSGAAGGGAGPALESVDGLCMDGLFRFWLVDENAEPVGVISGVGCLSGELDVAGVTGVEFGLDWVSES